jgi:DNA-binding transcriptional regulator PaaX
MLNPDPQGSGAPRAEEPSDELVLAALDRAARHRARDTAAVPVWTIFEHLGISRRSTAARKVRIRLDVMHAAGWIALGRAHGIQTWALTSAGVRHLRRERRAGRVPPLPESPQHQRWRSARITAAQEIGRFERELRALLAETEQMLDVEPSADSDAVFALGERLQRACSRLASASYCLREWAEPADARADLETHLDLAEAGLDQAEQAHRRALRAGRRNVRLWDERARGR